MSLPKTTWSVGRLVLDIPGLDGDGARLLAERVGAGLADLPISGVRRIERLSVTLPPGGGVQTQAAAIVSAVRGQLEGGD